MKHSVCKFELKADPIDPSQTEATLPTTHGAIGLVSADEGLPQRLPDVAPQTTPENAFVTQAPVKPEVVVPIVNEQSHTLAALSPSIEETNLPVNTADADLIQFTNNVESGAQTLAKDALVAPTVFDPSSTQPAEGSIAAAQQGAVAITDTHQPTSLESSSEIGETGATMDFDEPGRAQVPEPKTLDALAATRLPNTDDAYTARAGLSAPTEPSLSPDTPTESFPEVVDFVSAKAQVTSTSNQRTSSADALTQLANSMTGRLDDAGRLPARLEIELDPPELGRLNVELTDTRQGLLAKITASRESTAVLVDHQLAGLKQTLQESGIELHEFEVSYDASNSDSGNEPSGDSSKRAEERELAAVANLKRRERESKEGTATSAGGNQASQDSRVDLRV